MITSVERELSSQAGPLKAEQTAPEATSEADSTPVSELEPGGLVEPLTPRELEVLQLMAQGLTNQQMAEQLVISVGTVKWYTGQIYGKLAVNNRTQAVARARELKLLS